MKQQMDLTALYDICKLPVEPTQWPSHVVVYHLTPKSNVPSILANGLTAKPCKATHYGDSRREAVYLLKHKADTQDTNIRRFLFDTNEIEVLKVRIPRSEFANLREDGLFNVSCVCTDGTCPTGLQYIDNIPAEWIEEEYAND